MRPDRIRSSGRFRSTALREPWFDPSVSAKGVLIRYWLPVLVWLGVIFGGSTDLMSSERTSRFIGPVLRWMFPNISEAAVRGVQLGIRKTAHFLEYAILSALIWWALRKPIPEDPRPFSWRQAALAAFLAALYAVTDELHQGQVASRMAAVGDVGIDATGAVAGVVAIWWLGRWRNRW